MDNNFESIFFGWALGILGPIIIGFLANRRMRIRSERAIVEAFKDLKLRLSMLALSEKAKLGLVDEHFLLWLRKQRKDYDGYDGSDEERKQFLSLDFSEPTNRATMIHALNTAEVYAPSSYVELDMSIVDFCFSDVRRSTRSFVVRVLEIKFQVGVLNHEFRRSNEYLKMTFDSGLSDQNRKRIEEDLKVTCVRIANRCVQIVDKINDLMDKAIEH